MICSLCGFDILFFKWIHVSCLLRYFILDSSHFKIIKRNFIIPETAFKLYCELGNAFLCKRFSQSFVLFALNPGVTDELTGITDHVYPLAVIDLLRPDISRLLHVSNCKASRNKRVIVQWWHSYIPRCEAYLFWVSRTSLNKCAHYGLDWHSKEGRVD